MLIKIQTKPTKPTNQLISMNTFSQPLVAFCIIKILFDKQENIIKQNRAEPKQTKSNPQTKPKTLKRLKILQHLSFGQGWVWLGLWVDR